MRGGKRAGAGRPKQIEGAKRNFLYCTDLELEAAKKRLNWERARNKKDFFIDTEDYIFDILIGYPPGEPIFLHELYQNCTKDIASFEEYKNIVDKLIKENPNLKIHKYDNEIYFRTVNLCCLDMAINIQEVIRHKYMKDNGWYYTGYDLLNKIGLTTAMPKYTEIVSNSADMDVVDEDLKLKVYHPKTYITKENKAYFLLCNILEMLNNPCINAPNPNGIVIKFIRDNHILLENVYKIANKFYPGIVLDNLHLCLDDHL